MCQCRAVVLEQHHGRGPWGKPSLRMDKAQPTALVALGMIALGNSCPNFCSCFPPSRYRLIMISPFLPGLSHLPAVGTVPWAGFGVWKHRSCSGCTLTLLLVHPGNGWAVLAAHPPLLSKSEEISEETRTRLNSDLGFCAAYSLELATDSHQSWIKDGVLVLSVR